MDINCCSRYQHIICLFIMIQFSKKKSVHNWCWNFSQHEISQCSSNLIMIELLTLWVWKGKNSNLRRMGFQKKGWRNTVTLCAAETSKMLATFFVKNCRQVHLATDSRIDSNQFMFVGWFWHSIRTGTRLLY